MASCVLQMCLFATIENILINGRLGISKLGSLSQRINPQSKLAEKSSIWDIFPDRGYFWFVFYYNKTIFSFSGCLASWTDLDTIDGEVAGAVDGDEEVGHGDTDGQLGAPRPLGPTGL